MPRIFAKIVTVWRVFAPHILIWQPVQFLSKFCNFLRLPLCSLPVISNAGVDPLPLPLRLALFTHFSSLPFAASCSYSLVNYTLPGGLLPRAHIYITRSSQYRHSPSHKCFLIVPYFSYKIKIFTFLAILADKYKLQY